VERPPYGNVFTHTALFFLYYFYTRSPPTDLETHRWGLFHALDWHLVANECPDVVDPVSAGGEFPVLNVRAWAKWNEYTPDHRRAFKGDAPSVHVNVFGETHWLEHLRTKHAAVPHFDPLV